MIPHWQPYLKILRLDDLSKTLEAAQKTASTSAQTLTDLTARAEDMSRRLELQMASLHDIPQTPTVPEEQAPAGIEPKSKSPATPLFARRVQAATGDAA